MAYTETIEPKAATGALAAALGTWVLLSVLALSAACDGGTETREGEPRAEPSEPRRLEPQGAEAPPDPAPPERGSPPMKQHRVPPSSRVGSLPQGLGIAVGERAPDAAVEDADGRPVQLGALLENGPVMLLFYRGGWCPYCNFQIHEIMEALPEYQRRGVTPVAISVDRPQEAASTRADYDIPFPVLSDPELVAHRAFRVTHQADEAEVERLRGFGIDIERASGRDHHVIAVPSVFLIGSDGVVRWAHAESDYRVRPSNEQILAAIDAVGLEGEPP